MSAATEREQTAQLSGEDSFSNYTLVSGSAHRYKCSIRVLTCRHVHFKIVLVNYVFILIYSELHII